MRTDSEIRRSIELAKKPHCEKTDEEYEEYARIKFRVGFGQIVGPRYAAGDAYSRMFTTWWVKENEEFYRDGSELERLRKKNIKYYKK
ncbi:MAG: hypothetical protein ACTTGJ_03365 [Clostridium sp.]